MICLTSGVSGKAFGCKHDIELFSVAWPDNDEKLFAGPKSRDQAEHLCDLIARSSFDPRDENEGDRYLSFEDATLLGFL